MYLAGNLTLYIVPVVTLALFKFLIPIPAVRRTCYRMMKGIYRSAAAANVFLFNRILGLDMDVTGLEDLRPDQDLVVLVNHRSWTDILMVQNLLHRRAPIPKFISKWEVLFIPLVGLICWAYEFPLVRRYGRSYLARHPEKAGQDLRMLKDHFSQPDLSGFSIIIFAEGTRYTPAKAAARKSPYSHLLKPKSGGLTNVIQALGSSIDSLLDLTFVYDAPSPIFWNLLSGRCRKIVVRARTIHLADWFEKGGQSTSEVRRDLVGERLNELWREKDRFIETAKAGFDRTAGG